MKKTKRIISAVLALSLAVSSFVIPMGTQLNDTYNIAQVSAEDIQGKPISIAGTSNNNYTYIKDGDYFHTTDSGKVVSLSYGSQFKIMTLADGTQGYAYCISTPSKKNPNIADYKEVTNDAFLKDSQTSGIDYSTTIPVNSQVNTAGIQMLGKYGYPNGITVDNINDANHNTQKELAYYATQAAFRAYILFGNDWVNKSYTTSSNTSGSVQYFNQIKDKWKDWLAKGQQGSAEDFQEPTVTISGSDKATGIKVCDGKSYYVYGPYNAKTTNFELSDGFSVALSNKDCKVSVSKETIDTQPKYNESDSFYVWASIDSTSSETFKCDISLKNIDMTSLDGSIKNPSKILLTNSQYQDVYFTPIEIPDTPHQAKLTNASIQWANPTVPVTIKKVFGTGVHLDANEIKVNSSNNSTSFTDIPTTIGKVSGINNDDIRFVVQDKDSGQYAKFNENYTVESYTVDPAEAEVKLADLDGNLEDGLWTLNLNGLLPSHNYVIKEVSTDGNYSNIAFSLDGSSFTDGGSIELNTSNNNTVYDLNYDNRGKFEFNKVFVDTEGNTITNPDTADITACKFKLKNEAGQYLIATGEAGVYTYAGSVSDTGSELSLSADCKLSVDNLPRGTYTLEEVAHSDKYTASSVTAGILSNNTTTIGDITNRQTSGALTWYKSYSTFVGGVQQTPDQTTIDELKSKTFFYVVDASTDEYIVAEGQTGNYVFSNKTTANLDEATAFTLADDLSCVVNDLPSDNKYFIYEKSQVTNELTDCPSATDADTGKTVYYRPLIKMIVPVTISSSTPIQYISNLEQVKGDLTITKKGTKLGSTIDSSEVVNLAGAGFALYKDSNNNKFLDEDEKTASPVASGSTSEDGTLTFTDLSKGNYFIIETKAPAGYKISLPYTYGVLVNINETKVYAEEVIDTPLQYQISLIKTDNKTSVPVAGAGYTLYEDEACTTPVTINGTTEFFTDVNGSIIFDRLTLGDYWIKETSSPLGYKLDTTAYPVDFNQNAPQVFNATVEVEEQSVRGKLEVTKTGQSFEAGTVTAEEYQLPVGAKMPTADGNVIVDSSNNTVSVKKFNTVTAPIADVQFELYDAMGSLIDTQVTDTNGKAVWDNLLPGNYTVKETKSANGYILNTQSYKVFVKPSINEPDDGDTDLSITNETPNLNFSFLKYLEKSATNKYADAFMNVRFAIVANDNYDINKDGTIDISKGDYLDILKLEAELDSSHSNTYDSVAYWGTLSSKFPVGLNVSVKEICTDAHYVPKAGDLSFTDSLTKYTNITTSTAINNTAFMLCEKDAVLNSSNLVSGYGVVNEIAPGTVTLYKTDAETGDALTGAVFNIYADVNEDGEYTKDTDTFVNSMIQDLNGVYTIRGLSAGSYLCKEEKAPAGYVLSDTYVPFTISGKTTEDSQNIVLTMNKDGKFGLRSASTANPKVDTFVNIPQKGSIELTKSVDSDVPEDCIGIEFYLTKEDGTEVPDTRMLTDKTGKITWENLRVGDYIIKENPDTIPKGYEACDDGVVTVTYNKTIKYNAINHAIPVELFITKEDFANGSPLPNTGIAIYGSDKKTIIAEGLTNASGIYRFVGLELKPGDYYFRETKTPDSSYMLDTEFHKFTVTAFGTVIKETLTNTKIPADFVFTKTDIVNGQPIPNCEIVVKNTDTNEIVIDSFTDELGQIVIPDRLPAGNYTFQEKTAPEYYVLDTKEYPFTVDYGQNIVKCELSDSRIPIDTIIRKTDVASGEAIEGASIQIVNTDTDITYNCTSDNEGILVDVMAGSPLNSLPWGNYTYQETQAPDGYILNDAIQKFVVSNNIEKFSLDITNEKLPVGSVEFTKTDLVSGEAVPNAYISICKKGSTEEIFGGKTDSNGKLTIPNIPVGTYIFSETIVPEGYTTNDATLSEGEFTILENGQIAKCFLTNKKITGSVVIYKSDIFDTDMMLPGAEYVIYNSDEEEIQRGVTDQKGEVEFTDLPYGVYYYSEVTAPNGYSLDLGKYKFEITVDGATVECYAKDTPVVTDTIITTTTPAVSASIGTLPSETLTTSATTNVTIPSVTIPSMTITTTTTPVTTTTTPQETTTTTSQETTLTTTTTTATPKTTTGTTKYTTTQPSTPTAPKTGDKGVLAIITLGLVALTSAIVFRKKK